MSALLIDTAGAILAEDTMAAIIRGQMMSDAWDEMAAHAFTDEARYQAAKARFDALKGEC